MLDQGPQMVSAQVKGYTVQVVNQVDSCNLCVAILCNRFHILKLQ